jgi:hypothetical protein
MGLALSLALSAALPTAAQAESCITQSQMTAGDREALAQAALRFAMLAQANDASAARAATIPQYAQSFDGIGGAIAVIAPKIAGAKLSVTSLYLLDASGNAGTKDAQFFCSLNNSAEVIFNITMLPPGRYAMTTVRAQRDSAAWQLSFILQQQSGGEWKLAGFVPRAATAAGHDGVWYWKQARQYAKQSQRWNAWLYYGEADALLAPVEFMSSTNRDKLHGEQTEAMPKQMGGNGVSVEHPLSVGDYKFTAMGTQESADGHSLELAAHVAATEVGDPAAVRTRSQKALAALLAAYPELRGAFQGAWVYADAPGQSSFGIEFNPLPAGP